MSMNYHPSNVSPEPNANRRDWLDTFYTELKRELENDHRPEENLLDHNDDHVDDVHDMTGEEFFRNSILEQVYDPAYTSHSPIAKNANVRHDDGTDFPESKTDSIIGDDVSTETDLEMDNEKRADYDYIPDSMLAESSSKSKLDPKHRQGEPMKLSDLKLINVDTTYLREKGKKGVLKDVGPSSKYCATVCWELDGKPVVAVAVGYPDDGREEGDNYNWIGNLEVEKSLRGHGLGTQALDYAVKHLRGNALAVFCDNKVAIEMYKKYGFKISAESMKEVESRKVNYYQMFIGSALHETAESARKYRRIFVSTEKMLPAMLKNFEEQRNGPSFSKDAKGRELRRGPWDRAFGDIGEGDLWIHLGRYCTGQDRNYEKLKSMLFVNCTKALCEFEPYGNEWKTPTWVKDMLGFDHYGDNIKVGNLVFSSVAYPTQSGMINIYGKRVGDPVYDLSAHICVDDVIKDQKLDCARPILIDDLFDAARCYGKKFVGQTLNAGNDTGRYVRHPGYDVILTDAKRDKNFGSIVIEAQENLDESMTKAERDKLPDSMFGLPKQRRYPLHDEKHVRAAISMFHHCKDPEDRKTLAHNICRRIDELGMDIRFKKDSPIYPYAPKKLRLDESVAGFYGLNYMLDIPLDEAADWVTMLDETAGVAEFKEDDYLLPSKKLYPVVNEPDVRKAMDNISKISKDDRAVYVKHLNEKYRQLECTFQLPINHPYARYLDEVLCETVLVHVLSEGETAVADDGLGSDAGSSAEDPWYKRLDINGDFPKNLLQNHEIGPASSKQSKNINYDQYQSELD